MAFYWRRLPHWHPEDADIFVTWRLKGSLPRVVIEAGHGPAPLTPGQRFVLMDRELHLGARGPRWLEKSDIADAVATVLVNAQVKWRLYDLHAWAVMPNHVHLLFTAHKPVPAIMRVIKSASAREANLRLGHRGRAFWQDESYDHWVRDEKEFWRIVEYIEFNPVNARLAKMPEDCRWSSAYVGQAHGLP